MDAIAPEHHARALWRDLTSRIAQAAAHHRAHPARTVVLLPYAQLMPLARSAWAERVPDGFAPRFETTSNWASQQAFEPGTHDIVFDMGRDLLTARDLLTRAGLGARADSLAPRVVEAALQLAPLAASTAPAQRAAWAAKARIAIGHGMQAEHLRLEEAVARVAVEWAAASAYATDALLRPEALGDVDLLVILQGLHEDPLQSALAELAQGKAEVFSLAGSGTRADAALHACGDASDEAERAAACVLRHVEAGHTPVALAATDRAVTRRVAALLAPSKVPVRDEQGWKLSTTRSAAHVMVLLDACAWDARSDEVIDWLKHAPAVGNGAALSMERRIRRLGLRDWRSLRESDCDASPAAFKVLQQVNAWRAAMAPARPLADWLASLSQLLRETGQWKRLERDEAGAVVLDTLRLREGAASELQQVPQAGRRMDLADLRAWANEVMEAASFRPPLRSDAAVVILPFGQALARPFGAIVLPGCDEQRLPASPEPSGVWTPEQRRALGLPSREELQAGQALAWQQALLMPRVDVLWRGSDDNGEPLLASPLVQALQHEGARDAREPRDLREIGIVPVPYPAAAASQLKVEPLSASAYEDLRKCPYRFFALRQLGLKEADELESEVGKRDFGNWLHSVLRAFHESIRDDGEPAQGRSALLDGIASRALESLRLEEGEFLPFEAGWPAVRDAYLAWVAGHESSGAVFVEGESEHRTKHDGVALFGRIDRVDRLQGGRLLLIDYKTEGTETTRHRMRQPLEDTQLAFYALLLGEKDVEAAYLNIGERGKVTPVPHPDIADARARIGQGITDELTRIAQGAQLAALGEGRACEFCAARGLCRKDFWS